jgi:hypothetical protein
LFQVKEEFMYSVFECTLQTSQGKTFERQHEQDFDVQTLYKQMLTYLKKSTKAIINTSNILSYLASTCLDSTNWKGTSQDFLLHWADQLRQYEGMLHLKIVYLII